MHMHMSVFVCLCVYVCIYICMCVEGHAIVTPGVPEVLLCRSPEDLSAKHRAP